MEGGHCDRDSQEDPALISDKVHVLCAGIVVCSTSPGVVLTGAATGNIKKDVQIKEKLFWESSRNKIEYVFLLLGFLYFKFKCYMTIGHVTTYLVQLVTKLLVAPIPCSLAMWE